MTTAKSKPVSKPVSFSRSTKGSPGESIARSANALAAAAAINQCSASKLRMLAGVMNSGSFTCRCPTSGDAVWHNLSPHQQQAFSENSRACQASLQAAERHFQAGEHEACRAVLQSFVDRSARVSADLVGGI